MGTASDAGTVSGRREVEEDWLGTDVAARELVAVPDVVCWAGRCDCGGSAGISPVYMFSSWEDSEMIDDGWSGKYESESS